MAKNERCDSTNIIGQINEAMQMMNDVRATIPEN